MSSSDDTLAALVLVLVRALDARYRPTTEVTGTSPADDGELETVTRELGGTAKAHESWMKRNDELRAELEREREEYRVFRQSARETIGEQESRRFAAEDALTAERVAREKAEQHVAALEDAVRGQLRVQEEDNAAHKREQERLMRELNAVIAAKLRDTITASETERDAMRKALTKWLVYHERFVSDASERGVSATMVPAEYNAALSATRAVLAPSPAVPETPAVKHCDEAACDRCGRMPGVASDGETPYCHVCQHECTFTRSDLAPAARASAAT
jgi:hypothetical protein